MSKINKEENRKEWAAKIREFKRSGKTKEEWCQKKNISIKQFNYWYKHEAENLSVQWVPVEIKEENRNLMASPLGIEGIKILIKSFFRGLSGINCTADCLFLYFHYFLTPKKSLPFHCVPVISFAIADRLL